MAQRKKAGIIGAGILGIDIARKLAREGYDVTLIETSEIIGGLTVHTRIGGYLWDKFYHVVLPDDQLTIRMIKDIGLEDLLVWKETKTGFFVDGKYFSMSSISEFIKLPALNLFDKFRLGLTILAGSFITDYKRLESIPVSVWLRRWSGERTFTKIWQPLLKAKLGEDYKSVSAAFICATIKRLYGARKSGTKKEIFGYVKGGYYNILNRLKDKIIFEEIKILTDSRVNRITRSEKGLIKVELSQGITQDFDFVISTLPSPLCVAICPDLTESEKDKLARTRYMGVICLSVLLKRELSPYYITNVTDERINLTGIIEMTALVDKNHFGGNTLVYLPRYLNSEDPLFNETDQLIKERYLTSLKIIQPDLKDEEIIEFQVARARYVIAIPEMGYSNTLPSFTTSLANIFIINSSFITDGTLNVNETLKVSAKYLPEVLKLIKNED